jgi:hypothetical protein
VDVQLHAFQRILDISKGAIHRWQGNKFCLFSTLTRYRWGLIIYVSHDKHALLF